MIKIPFKNNKCLTYAIIEILKNNLKPYMVSGGIKNNSLFDIPRLYSESNYMIKYSKPSISGKILFQTTDTFGLNFFESYSTTGIDSKLNLRYSSDGKVNLIEETISNKLITDSNIPNKIFNYKLKFNKKTISNNKLVNPTEHISLFDNQEISNLFDKIICELHELK
jgi:hypothetical protein